MKTRKEVVVSARRVAYARMVKQGLRDARNVLNNHELFRASECALAARIIKQHGAAYQ